MTGVFRELLPGLPLPLAHLARRALNAKSSVERHNCAYYLGEAALKLAASARIGAYLVDGLVPKSALARKLEALALPSTGHWCGFLRDVGAALSEPAGDSVFRDQRLEQKRSDWQAVSAFADRCEQLAVISREVRRAALNRGALGFFELLCAYRTEVLGHGSQRSNAFYDECGTLLSGALAELIAKDSPLFEGMRLVRCQEVDGEHRWQVLCGLAGLPLETQTSSAGDASKGQLYFLADKGPPIGLHPLVICVEDDFGREQVGFLNRTVRRRSRATVSAEVRRTDYLDYATGETLSGVDTRDAVAALLGRLRDDSVSPSEVARLAAEQAADVEETLLGGDTKLLGEFELLEELGRGAMGVVYRARQLSVDRVVALKVLPPSLAVDRTASKRFQREIAALARCDHPNVVKVLTSGADDGHFFYAMELVEGADLARVSRCLSRWRASSDAPAQPEWLAAAAASDPPGKPPASKGSSERFYRQTATLFAGAAAGLSHLHEAELIHRDIKPGNVMLTADGQRLVIMDLGLVKAGDESEALTSSDIKIVGTLAYMAPEQLQRQLLEVDHRADIYGLGATLYELCAGNKPFDGDNERRLIQQVLNEQPPALAGARPAVPRDLQAVVQRAMQKNVATRYQRASLLEADLLAVAERRPISFRGPGFWSRARRVLSAHKAAFALLLVVLASALAVQWYYLRNHVFETYYANRGERDGHDVGIGEVASWRGRHRTWRFLSRGDRVLRIERVNGHGQLVADGKGTARVDLVYDQQGRLVRRVLRRRNLAIRQKHVFTPRDDGGIQVAITDRHDLRATLDDSEVAVYRRYDKQSWAIRRLHFNDRGSPRPDARGAYGYAFKVDRRGLVEERRSLDAAGRPRFAKHGIALTRFRYDTAGNLIERCNFGSRGRPVLGGEGYACWRGRYERGNLIRQRYYGIDGELTFTDKGLAEQRSRYDAHGDEIERGYFDRLGRPTLHVHGYASFRAVYDARGNATSRRYLNIAGKPTVVRAGYAAFTARHDARGNRIELRFASRAGKPVLDARNLAGWRRELDLDENVTRYAHLGVDDKPSLARDGTAGRRSTYRLGREVERVYLGVDGKPTPNKDGIAIWNAGYDELGREIRRRFFDAKRAPVLGVRRIAGWDYRYDGRGNRERVAYVGLDGKTLVESVEGIAGWRTRFDKHGNPEQVWLFGKTGKPALHKDGAYGWRATFDASNREVRRTYLNARDKPMRTHEGVTTTAYEYDRRGNITLQRYLGVDGKPALNEQKVAGWRARHNARGRTTWLQYFGLDGAPKLSRLRIAGWRAEHDERGNEIRVRFFGVDGRTPALHAHGFAGFRSTYDARSRQVGRMSLGLDGQPIAQENGAAGWRDRFDARGNAVERTNIGVDGKPVAIKAGWAILARRYDARGNAIESRFFSPERKPTANKNGHARIRSRYDAFGDVVRRSFIDLAGKQVGELRVDYRRARRVRIDLAALRLSNPALFHGSSEGVVVAGVLAGGQFDKAGLKPGDIVVRYDGKVVHNAHDLRHARVAASAKRIKLLVIRGVENIEAEVASGKLGIMLL